jgi:hypothetical protein
VLGQKIRKQSGKRWSFIWRGLAIGRVLKFRTVAILTWIRFFGVQDLRTNAPAKIVELDEMHTYIGSKKNIAGYGVLLTEMEKDSSTGFKGSCHRAKTLKRHQRMCNKKRDDGLLEAV